MKNIKITTVTCALLLVLVACGKQAEEKEESAAKAEKATEEVKKERETKTDKKPLDVKRKKPQIAAPPDVAAPPADAEKTKSNLASKVLNPGTGKVHPKETDKVTVHYTGWTTDGKMFDSSVQRKRPSTFPLNRVIKGWTEGVQLMVEGEKRRFWIPEELAYKGKPGKPLGMLVFDVELIKIVVSPPAPEVPKDVAAPPPDAKKTKSNLASKLLKAGTGSAHPAETDVVEVHYSGWTTDGKMFDSSVSRGKPVKFPLNRVIKGWTEGVQLMVEGEKRRFWIPEELAYKGKPGKPLGMLVFDVELIS
ncbi:MAG: peptidylprolyl isomerase, partial [Deltaproteobacteria bacterium]|nr:peptidylprolyl isomerase [Deltaproteobacteria bacterium]